MKHCLVFASLISPSKMILFEKKYQTFDTVFHHQMKHLEVRQKYSAARRIFNSLLGVSSGDETLHLMFDILLLSCFNLAFYACYSGYFLLAQPYNPRPQDRLRIHGPNFSSSCPAVQIEITVTRENLSELIKCIMDLVNRSAHSSKCWLCHVF